MAQIVKKFIANQQVDETKILLNNQGWLQALNTSSNPTNVMRLNGSNVIEFATLPTTTTGTPANPQDLVTKAYVDNLINGLNWKTSAKAAGTGNVPLTGSTPLVMDSTAVNDGDRVFLWNQTDNTQNGLYLVSVNSGNNTYSMTRASDLNTPSEFPSATVTVEYGATLADTQWVCSNQSNPTLGSTPITWVRLPSLNDLVAGTGLTKVNYTLNVNVDNSSTQFNGSNQIAAKMDPNGGITFSGNGIAVNWEAVNPSLKVNAQGQLGVKMNPSGAITSQATGLTVGVDNVTTQIVSNNVVAKIDPTSPITTSASGMNIGVDNQSTQIVGNKLVAKIAAAGAISQSAGGMTVNVDGQTVVINGSNNLQVKLDPGGAIVYSANGLALQLEATNPTLQIATDRLGVKYSGSASGLTQDATGLKIKLDSSVDATTRLNGNGELATPIFKNYNYTLTNTDITNQYVNLPDLATNNSVRLAVSGVRQRVGTDYTISAVGGVTRISFGGDLAAGGAAALVAGDTIYFDYKA